MARYFCDSGPLLTLRDNPHEYWEAFDALQGHRPQAATPSGGGLNRAEMRELIANTLADPELAKILANKEHPKYEELHAKMTEAHLVAFPKEAAQKIDVPAAPAAAPPGTAPSAMTAEQARVAIVGRQTDKEFQAAYYKNDHPGHALAVQQMADLHRAAYPSGPEVVDADEPVALPGGFNLV